MPITLDGTGSISGLSATGISAVQNLPATGTITNLTTTTISDGTNSTSSTNVIQGSAKAWVNFNGTGTVAIRASYNVSSITDNGTGNYTINFTNALTDADYVGVFGCNDNGNTTTMNYRTAGTKTASAFQVSTVADGANLTDNDMAMVAVFR